MLNKIEKLKNKYQHDKESIINFWNYFSTEGKKCIKEFKNKDTRHKQIPNAFTASRLFAPFFIIPAALFSNVILTGIFASLFALTDAADGYFARKFKATSEFGRELDPITDKIFACSLLFPLTFFNPSVIIILVLEIITGTINLQSKLEGNKPATVMTGKVKTGSLYLTIILSYISMMISINPTVIASLIATTGTLQFITAAKYYINYKDDEKAKKLKSLQNDETIINNNNVEEKELVNKKELVSNKKEIKENVNDLTISEKIKKLNILKEELVPNENEKENIKLYQKK